MVVSQLTALNMDKHKLISNSPESLPTRICLKAVGFPPCCVIYPLSGPLSGRSQRVLIPCLGGNVSPGAHMSRAESFHLVLFVS